MQRSCTLLLFEVLSCWRRWREWIARKNDRHGGFTAVRAVAVYIVGSGCFETNKPILVKWRWNTLTQRFLQVVRNTKKPCIWGLNSKSASRRKGKHSAGKKALCSPYIMLWARCRSRGSMGVWNAGRATREQYGVNFTGSEQEHGGRKRLFTNEDLNN